MNAHAKLAMSEKAREAARWATEASDAERVAFPQVVQMLAAAGVERYHADLVASTKTYYMPDGAFESLRCHSVAPPAANFEAKGVEAAVRAIQAQTIKYREFRDRIAAAGCVGYFVTLAGGRAVYYGRTGDEHVEWFPGAK
jgi:uncharacterized protein YbcV (DUF1398 family)